jgi:hypothetical protein
MTQVAAALPPPDAIGDASVERVTVCTENQILQY